MFEDDLPKFVANQPAALVDQSLRRALGVVDRAQECAILWFAEVARRALYTALGHASLELYAVNGLGFSRNRYYQFKRLADDLERLPKLKAAVAAGHIGWTKAQQVARVATPASEATWIDRAATTGRREFTLSVRSARARAQARRRDAAARELVLSLGTGGVGGGGGNGDGVGGGSGDNSDDGRASGGDNGDRGRAGGGFAATSPAGDRSDHDADPPVTVSFRLDGIQTARYEALMERIRKRRVVPRRASREEILLAALESLADDSRRPAPADAGAAADAATDATAGTAAAGDTTGTNQTCAAPDRQHGPKARLSDLRRRNWTPPLQIVVRRCPECERMAVVTSRGDRNLSKVEAEAACCDARIHAEGHRTRSVIPLAIRAKVLKRDAYRCCTPGCGATRFLELHHIVPQGEGGSNKPENLITLCSRCHRFAHEGFKQDARRTTMYDRAPDAAPSDRRVRPLRRGADE